MSSEETGVGYERFLEENDRYELEPGDYDTDRLRVDMSHDSDDIRIRICAKFAVFMSSLLLALNIANQCWGSAPELVDTSVYRP
jgi:hypothetical protein